MKGKLGGQIQRIGVVMTLALAAATTATVGASQAQSLDLPTVPALPTAPLVQAPAVPPPAQTPVPSPVQAPAAPSPAQVPAAPPPVEVPETPPPVPVPETQSPVQIPEAPLSEQIPAPSSPVQAPTLPSPEEISEEIPEVPSPEQILEAPLAADAPTRLEQIGTQLLPSSPSPPPVEELEQLVVRQAQELQLAQTATAEPLARLSVASATVDVRALAVTLPSVSVTVPSTPVSPPVRISPPTAPVSPPSTPVTPPAPPVEPPRLPPVNPPPVNPPPVNPAPVNPPSIPRPSLPSRPSLPVDPPSLPVTPRSGPGPVTPRLPSVPRVGVGAPGTRGAPGAGGGAGGVGDGVARTLDSIAGGSAPSTATGGSGAAGVSLESIGALTQAAPGLANVPSRAELAEMPPAQRRKVLRQIWGTPVRKEQLRQLRAAILENQGCLDGLSARGRRTLLLRAGLFGREPASRRVIARRLGLSLTRTLQLERSSLRRLVSAGERGLCGGGGGGWAIPTPSELQAAAGEPAGATASAAGGSDLDDPSPVSDVLADVHEGGPGVDLGDGDEGATETLLFFLIALLGPLAAIAIASRRRAASGAAAAAAVDPRERPLLFLDVDGVIALNPFSNALPPGRVRELALGSSYVPDRAGELVRELTTRFDVVWASGWEHHANTSLLRLLGLAEALPVLTFGRKARHGSSKWKIRRVDEYARHRPAAWLDDHFVARHERWAAHRAEPTLLAKVDPRAGLGPEHVERLMQWADRVAPAAPVVSRNGRRRAQAG